MNQKKALLLLATLALASCGEPSTPVTSSSEETPASSLPISSIPDTPASSEENPIDYPKTASKLRKFIGESAAPLEKTGAISYHREASSYRQILFGDETVTLKEDATSYSNQVLYAKGSTHTQTTMDGENETPTDASYVGFMGVKGDTFYLITDYADGKDNDKMQTKKVSELTSSAIKDATSIAVTSTFDEYYDQLFASHYVEGFDDVLPEDRGGKMVYSLSQTWKQEGDSETDYYSVTSHVTLDSEGRLSAFDLDYKIEVELTADDGKKSKSLYAETKDSYVVTFGASKAVYDFSLLDPIDYVMTDYEVQFLADDGTSLWEEGTFESELPYGMYLKAVTKSVTPEKALDTSLSITASSDNTVVEVKSYQNDDGTKSYSVKAIKEGSATLTVVSASGIAKQVPVTVKAPALTSLEVNLYSHAVYVGDTDHLYITKNPSNSLDAISVVSSDPTVAEVIQEAKGGYSLKFLKEGDFTVTVTSVKDPTITASLTKHVYAKMSDEAVRNNIPGTWTSNMYDDTLNGQEVYHPITFTFAAYDTSTSKGTGTMTFGDNFSRLPFVKDQTLSFTYENEDTSWQDRVSYDVTVATFTDKSGSSWEYTGRMDCYLNGDIRLNLAPSDGELYYFTMQGDLVKQVVA